MTWADNYIYRLNCGESVTFRPRGGSMIPLVYSGQLVTIMPVKSGEVLKEGTVVLCLVKSRAFLHKIWKVQNRSGKIFYQIGRADGFINGWTPATKVYGWVSRIV